MFNFFRPGYVPTSKVITDAGLVAPELQIDDEVSVAGYLNFMRDIITGISTTAATSGQDYSRRGRARRQPGGAGRPHEPAAVLRADAGALKTQIVDGVASRTMPAPIYPVSTAPAASARAEPTNQAAIDAAKLNRVYLAVFLSMASPDYLIQK